MEGLSDLVNSLLEKEASKRPTAADILTNKLVQNALHDLRESLRQSQRDDGTGSEGFLSKLLLSHSLRHSRPHSCFAHRPFKGIWFAAHHFASAEVRQRQTPSLRRERRQLPESLCILTPARHFLSFIAIKRALGQRVASRALACQGAICLFFFSTSSGFHRLSVALHRAFFSSLWTQLFSFSCSRWILGGPCRLADPRPRGPGWGLACLLPLCALLLHRR